MTSDLCADDVVVRITTPQIITSQTLVSGGVASGAGGAGGAGARVAASSAAVELGRRLLVAARAGDTQLVLDLMAKGAPFTTDWLGTSALHLAAGGAHAGTCAVLLRAGVSRDARSKVERTPLHLAAGAGHAAVARLLLEAGAAVDARDMLRMTPLHWAVQNGHAAAAAELLAAGADPALRNKFRKSPLELARRLRRADLVRLLEDALRQREAARSVSALVDEQMAEVSTAEPDLQAFDAVERIQDMKQTRPTKLTEKTVKEESKMETAEGAEAESAESAGELLRRHGITLLPAEAGGGTVLSALQCGRTVVLSDAGKLMLKESSEAPPAASKASSLPTQAKGVVLTATPVKSPPKPGVKIFTLNNKLLAVPKDNKMPVKKIINPQDMQVKFVQLPPDTKLVSPSKIVPMKAKSRMAVRQATTGVTSPARPAVKIIMNKSNFHRLLATAGAAQAVTTGTTTTAGSDTVEGEVALPDELPGDAAAGASTGASPGADCDSPAWLRAQLGAATRALAAARRELRVARARLAHLERLHAG